ncbi:DegT/DnrJ/EryC1/StrS family aminotransferase [Microvirga sp. 2TAF3]|uniref:DegT/DnrJ/EryC1/StrS family aminotransferase n=1 Tax=Microvirga sp. 2TAF3 TaxID=3233014 RepID=UPI003F94AF83
MSDPIAFIDLAAQRNRIGSAMDEAILRVVNHGGYIMGPEVKTFEADLSAFCGAKHVISCANGTDALLMVLMAKGVKEGDAVLCPSFTFAATAEVVAQVNATPIFVDVLEDTFNLDMVSLEAGLKTAKKLGLNPVGVIPVDLFGLPADYEPIEAFCKREGLWLMCDAAQSFGASYKGRKVGVIGDCTTTSFFPAKPLGCYGDGGAIFTNDDELATVLRSIRVHGQGTEKYDNVRIGMNGRLDTMQAAVLIEKLKIFPSEIEARDRVAKYYNDNLRDVAVVPEVPEGYTSVWAQYTLRMNGFNREQFQADLKAAGVPTAVYYPKPLNQQTAYKHYPVAGNGVPVSERLAAEVVSLPMHPYLTEEVQDRIIAAVKDAMVKQRKVAAE